MTIVLFHLPGNCEFNAMSELRNLKSRIEELESELRERDEEVRAIKQQQQAEGGGGVNGAAGDDKAVAVSVYGKLQKKPLLEKIKLLL